MLYDPNDPKWEKPKTKLDIFSLAGLIAWLEQQPAATCYNYSLPSSCLVAQYLKEKRNSRYCLLSTEIKAIGWHDIVFDKPRTFGAALERARKLASSSVQP